MQRYIQFIPICVLIGLGALFYLEQDNVKRNFFSPEYAPYVQYGMGTGYFVNDTTVLTNEHVVRGCRSLRITEPEYARGSLTLIVEDKFNDLAALKTNVTPKNIAVFRKDDDIQKEDKVAIIGYPGGKYKFKTATVVQPSNYYERTYPEHNNASFMERKIFFTDSVRKGNSGGPLLDYKGNVIGTIDAYLTLKEFGKRTIFGSAVHNIRTKAFLEEYNIPFYETNREEGQLSDKTLEEYANQFIVKIRCIK